MDDVPDPTPASPGPVPDPRSLEAAWPDRDRGDPDWEWHSGADSPDALLGRSEEAVARSRVAVREALATGGLDQQVRGEDPPRNDASSGPGSST